MKPVQLSRGSFLKRFSPENRATIGQLFFQCARQWVDSVPSVDELIAAVRARIVTLARENPPNQPLLEAVFSSLHLESAKVFAEYVCRRQALPLEERRQLTRGQNEHFLNKHLAAAPPSEKQLAFLRTLGCDETPTSRLAAHVLIASLREARSESEAA